MCYNWGRLAEFNAIKGSKLLSFESGSMFEVWWRKWIVCIFAFHCGCFVSQLWWIWLMVVMPPPPSPRECAGSWAWARPRMLGGFHQQSQVFTSSPETWVQMTDGILRTQQPSGTRSFVFRSDSTGSNTCSWAHSCQSMYCIYIYFFIVHLFLCVFLQV